MKLRYLLSYTLVKLSHTRATQLEGLEEGIILIEPISTSYKIKIYTKEGKPLQRTIKSLQFPVTAAYAFTDYRSQGQTIRHVIIDIASPPTGTLSLFNLYVALSRSAGRHSIHLLRDFDDRIFKRESDQQLINEDARLAELDLETKNWYGSVTFKHGS